MLAAETSQNAAPPDIVLCGGCRASYPLSEIVRFIEHKVNHCRSSLPGCQSPTPAAAPEDSDPEDALALKTDPTGAGGATTTTALPGAGEKLSSVPSISAPIIKRSGRVESPPTPQGGTSASESAVSPIELRASASSTPKRRGGALEAGEEALDKDEPPKKPKTESVDADTNTVSTGEW